MIKTEVQMMKKNYCLLALAAVALAACSGDTDGMAGSVPPVAAEIQEPAAPISLTASMSPGSGTTRAVGTLQAKAFDADEFVRVEVTPAGGTMQSSVYQAAEAVGSVNKLTAYSTALTWPANGTAISVRAFYPSWVGSTTDRFTIETTQADAAAYKASDLMYASVENQTKTADNPVDLTFSHCMAKVIVNINKGSGVTDEDIAASIVSVYANTQVDIASGQADKATAAEPAWRALGNGSGQAAIIVPQVIDGSEEAREFIRVAIGGNNAVYKLAKLKEFSPGKKYTYTLKVSVNGILLQSTAIEPWDDRDGANTIDATGNPLTF